MTERNGVRVGQRVRDLDGNALGRVEELYDSGFSVGKGLPFLFRSELVARWDEIREVRADGIVLARSSRDLLDLAAGRIPPAWRVDGTEERPVAATPAEASVRGGRGEAVPARRGSR